MVRGSRGPSWVSSGAPRSADRRAARHVHWRYRSPVTRTDQSRRPGRTTSREPHGSSASFERGLAGVCNAAARQPDSRSWPCWPSRVARCRPPSRRPSLAPSRARWRSGRRRSAIQPAGYRHQLSGGRPSSTVGKGAATIVLPGVGQVELGADTTVIIQELRNEGGTIIVRSGSSRRHRQPARHHPAMLDWSTRSSIRAAMQSPRPAAPQPSGSGATRTAT